MKTNYAQELDDGRCKSVWYRAKKVGFFGFSNRFGGFQLKRGRKGGITYGMPRIGGGRTPAASGVIRERKDEARVEDYHTSGEGDRLSLRFVAGRRAN